MPEPSDPVRDFLVPDLGEGLDDLTVVTWRVAVGDTVELNQTLCSVETAKAEVDVPSPYAGTVLALGGEEGDTLAVGTLLARVAVAEEDPSPPNLVGYGPDDAIGRSRRTARLAEPAPQLASVATSRPRARPPVRRLARDLGIDLRDLAPGSGPVGIVTRADVEAATPPPAAAAATNGTTIPVRGVRARTAERLTHSHLRVPTASCRVVADCTRLLDVRASLNAHAEQQGLEPVITPFALLAHFATRALRMSPTLNASWDDSGPAIQVHDDVHLGVATATGRGLLVTVARDAGGRSADGLATELARLTAAARAGTATPSELQGSTFTISNFGALGLDDGTPIINPPEAAILGVGSIRRRPHVVDDEVVARSTAALTLVFDHRIADGAEAGRYLCELRALIESPELALI